MSTLSAIVRDGILTAGGVGVLYTATVTTAALTALLARTSARRRDAQKVLKILLRRRKHQP